MLLKPSCSELMTKLNFYNLYGVVAIVAKFARQVNKNKNTAEENRFTHVRSDSDAKAISVAIKKLLDEKVKIMVSVN